MPTCLLECSFRLKKHEILKRIKNTQRLITFAIKIWETFCHKIEHVCWIYGNVVEVWVFVVQFSEKHLGVCNYIFPTQLSLKLCSVLEALFLSWSFINQSVLGLYFRVFFVIRALLWCLPVNYLKPSQQCHWRHTVKINRMDGYANGQGTLKPPKRGWREEEGDRLNHSAVCLLGLR